MDAATSVEPVTRYDRPGSRLRARARAFAIHLAISAVISAVLIAVIAFHWYPGPYFAHDGGWRGTLIVLGVDFVLGPTLTLIIYDPRKSIAKIRFDFAVIGLLQAGALAWGVHAVEGQRPAAVAWFDGAFNPVTAEVLRAQGVSPDRFRALSDLKPPLVFTRIPTDPGDAAEMRRQRAELGLMPYSQASLLRGLDGHMVEVARRQERLAWMKNPRPRFAGELESFLSEQGRPREAFVWVPFNGRYGRILFVFEPDGRLVGTLAHAYEGLL